MFLVAGAVGAASRFGIGIGTGATEFFFFMKQHFDTETCHHECDYGHGYSEYY